MSDSVRWVEQVVPMGSDGDARLQRAVESGRPTVFTRGDDRVAIVLPPSLYDELLDAQARLELIEALDEGEARAATEGWLPHAAVVERLRRWAG